MQIRYLTNDVLLPLPEEAERHDEGNSQITEDIGSGMLRRLEKSNELPGKNDQIKGRYTFSD